MDEEELKRQRDKPPKRPKRGKHWRECWFILTFAKLIYEIVRLFKKGE